MTERAGPPKLTIVTPSFEKHVVQFGAMIDSLVTHCRDLSMVELVVIVEDANEAMFAALLARYPTVASRILVTEDVLADFGIRETAGSFLRRVGKFTFQTLKKMGGLLAARSDWSLILDSETVFHNAFDAVELLNNYRQQKYVFFTWTSERGKLWRESTGCQVTSNAAAALHMHAGDRWYMEYFHWFYETDKARDLIRNRLGRSFFERLADPTTGAIDYFENILYYLYLEKYHSDEYEFVDFKQAVDTYLPGGISRRFELSELPFSLFGNEYLLNILAPDDVSALAPLFERYRLPFVRLEPPLFSPRYLAELRKLPTFVATISSHHLIWLRKKVAVCISGEFRHIVHRVPEHQVRHMLGFLAGVDCDIFLHGWSNSSEALILDALKPRAWKFEPRPSFGKIVRQIKVPEPNIKPGRDEGSLAMFHGIEQAFGLLEPYADDYDYVLRIRPDIYSELSLKEIMVKISDEGDFLPDAIYFPKSFHSKGINDQIAFGPVAKMSVYAHTLEYIKNNVQTIFFNPESMLLRHLLAEKIELVLVDMPYALMREIPLRIGTIHERFFAQFRTWWSRTEDLPVFQDLSAFFADKLRAMESMMLKQLPRLIYVRGPKEQAGGTDAEPGGREEAKAVVRATVFDNDPSRPASGLFRWGPLWQFRPFVLRSGAIAEVADGPHRQLFIFPEGSDTVVSEWRYANGKLVNNRLVAGPEDVSPVARTFGIRMKLVFYLQRRRERRRRS